MHGWPGRGTERRYRYCEHRRETFPGWHRAYLVAFERALQAADKAGMQARVGAAEAVVGDASQGGGGKACDYEAADGGGNVLNRGAP